MHPQDIRTLRLLEALEADPGPSQRDLARQLNVSLGLINSFVKRLARKGYFKVTHVPKSRMRYILTPKGALEKARLTCEYIQFSYAFYKDARCRLRRLFAALSRQGIRRVAFYGVGDLAEMAFISLQEFPIRLEAVVCGSQCPGSFLGRAVQGPEQVDWTPIEAVLLTEPGPHEEAIGRLAGLGLARQRIIVP
jgi:DNA-binding MarR family transcriptional regulator